MITKTKDIKMGKLYAGLTLPEGAIVIGTVTRYTGETGALVRLANGREVQYNSGVIKSLPRPKNTPMKTKIITIKNDFHSTETTARVKMATMPNGKTINQSYGTLSPSQVSRIGRELCGITGCSCSSTLGARGHQDGWQEYEGNIGGDVDIYF